MARLIPKLAAGSLMEVVVAMVIISVISSVTLVIYLNTMQSMTSGRQHQLESTAQYYLQSYENLPKEQKEGFVDEAGNEIAFEQFETAWEGLDELVVTLTDSLDLHTIEQRRLIFIEE